MEIELRQESPHSETAITLVQELWDELGVIYGNAGPCEFVPSDIDGPGTCYLIAWDAETAVACGAVRPHDEESVGEVKRMYVRPAYRGMGLSRRVLEEIERRAPQLGYQALALETGTPQIAAVSLYETSGYYRIPNFGPYMDDPLSVCFRKDL